MFKQNKILSLFFILFLVVILNLVFYALKVKADNASTTAAVANKAPTFTAGPAENPASTASSPTLVGNNVTFQATATDKNGDQYYLAICKGQGITAGSNGPPTCTSGQWCISSATNSGSQASCSYQVQQTDASSNDWYAYVCDKNTSGQCSSYSQGSGDSGSPFYVNHQPTFTSFSDDSPKDPGGTVTFSTTASDQDGDNVILYVCKSNDFNGSTCGAGGEWCHSSASASNPTCQYNIPNVFPDDDYAAYGYIVDSRGLQASGGSQGSNSVLTVNNVAPSISASSIQVLDTDESGYLTLTVEQGQTTGFKVKFTVVDNNSCQKSGGGNEIASAVVHLRTSDLSQSQCDEAGEANNNDCYPVQVSCSQDAGSCNGTSDSDATWTCTFGLQYHADPTVAGTPKASYQWVAAVKATDDDGANSGLVDSTTYSNELDTFVAYDLTTSTIAYGSLDPGTDSSEQSLGLKATGNVGLDSQVSGTDMTSGSDTIAVSQQHYNLQSGQGWGSGTALSATATEVELNCKKTTITATPETKNIYWILRVPDPQPAGSYSGTNTITGVIGEPNEW